MSNRWILKLLGLLFVFVVVLPFAATWGPGIETKLGSLRISHHAGGRPFGAFFILIGILFLAWPRFRRQFLQGAEDYDRLPTERHSQIEKFFLLAIALWLGILKVCQCRQLLTACWDHGIYLNVMWNLTHGSGFWSSFRHMNFLGDHFNPMLALLAPPFRWFVWPSWPLLAQTGAMMGAIALIVALARRDHFLPAFERLLLILFLSSNLYFHTVHRFDMHPVAFSPLVLMAAYLLAKRDRWPVFYSLLPIALFAIQEDVSLMVLGLGLYLLSQREKRRHGVITALLSLLAFWLNVNVFIPSIGGAENVYAARYMTMGGDLQGIVKTFLLRPWAPVQLLFSKEHLVPLIILWASFGFSPFFAGSVALMLLPSTAQQSLSDYATQSGYGAHYSSNVLPFLMLALLIALARHRPARLRLVPVACGLLAWFGLRAPRYLEGRDPAFVKTVWSLARDTPPEIPVAVQNTIGVPFAFRHSVYGLKDLRDAQLIVLSRDEKPWPFTPEELIERIASLENDPTWQKEEKNRLLVFRRRS